MEGIDGQGTSAIAAREHEALPQSELLAAIVASSQEAIISKTLDGIITTWNPAAERIYGYTAEEAIGKHISIIVPREHWPELNSVTQKLAQGESVPPFETIQCHKDGQRLEVIVSPSSVKDANGTVIGTSTLNTDITGRKHAEERLNIAAQSITIGAWDWDIRAKTIHWSPMLQEMHHFPPGQLQCGFDAFIDSVHPADRQHVLQTFSDMQQHPGEFCFEYRMAQDETIWFEGRGRVLLDRHGTPERMIGICIDVSRRKQNEEALRRETALRESETRLRELAEAMPHMVWIADPQGTIVYANQQYFNFTGASGLLASEGARFVHPEDLPRVEDRWREIFRSGIPHSFEFRLLGRSGLYHWHLVRMTPVKDAQGHITRWIGTSTDIDSQKRAAQAQKIAANGLERKVQERTAELNQSLTFLEDFLYNMGHHLRAPLRAIVGFMRILLEDNAPSFDAQGQEKAQRIIDAATRMDQLLNDLIAFGRISHEDIPCTTVDLDFCIKEALRSLAPEIGKTNAQVDVHHPLPSVCAHQKAVETVLSNLISNALKFVPRGTPPKITIRAEYKDSYVRLWVIDNGLGIPAEHLRRVFRPFERLHGYAEFPGTGVGLAIVKRSVERMKGSVGVSSEPGKGSSFWIELPVDEGSLPVPGSIQPKLDFLAEDQALVVTDMIGRVRWVNPTFTRITGYALDEIRGKRPGAFLQGPATDLVEIQKLREAIRTHKKCTVAVINYRKNGEPFWYLITLGPIRREGRYVGFASVQGETTLPISDTQKQQLRCKLRRAIAQIRKMPELI